MSYRRHVRKSRIRVSRRSGYSGPCWGKKTYPSLKTATGVARSALRNDRRLYPYHCRDCGGWHLTSGKESA